MEIPPGAFFAGNSPPLENLLPDGYFSYAIMMYIDENDQGLEEHPTEPRVSDLYKTEEMWKRAKDDMGDEDTEGISAKCSCNPVTHEPTHLRWNPRKTRCWKGM